MTLTAFIKQHYPIACAVQRDITQDDAVVTMLRRGPADAALMQSWMRSYGLFQGITSADRTEVAKRFVTFVSEPDARRPLSGPDDVASRFSDLYIALYDVLPRTWTSATSKLLWCMFPDTIVIYDSFVHRAALVLQCVDPVLRRYPRIGWPPSVTTKSEIAAAVAFYLNFQLIVRTLAETHAALLNDLRIQHAETYPYDIRILDKLLWMIGDADYEVWPQEA